MDNNFREFPLVSICIPTYNGEKYLLEALTSVKKQTYKNIEVIISDDNSIDSTIEICKNFKREVNFPVFIYNHKPSGIGANWNNCIQNSNGKYIKLLFQDDLLAPNCIEIMLSYIIGNKLEAVVCKRNIISENKLKGNFNAWMNKYGDLQKGINLEFKDFYQFSSDDLYRLGSRNELSYNFIGEPVTALFSRKKILEIGLFSSKLKQLLDLEFYLRILKTDKIGIINNKLISFRVHNNQTSSINARLNVDEGKIIEKYLIINFYSKLTKFQKKWIIYNCFPLFNKMMRLKYKFFNK